MPVLENINGDTALDLAFPEDDSRKCDINLADTILNEIKDYPFMHSGFVLVSGILKAFKENCPHLKDYLDARLKKSSHLSARSLRSRAIKKKILPFKTGSNSDAAYGTMIANPW